MNAARRTTLRQSRCKSDELPRFSYGITAPRTECDAYAVQLQQRAAAAQQSGAFSRSLVPIGNVTHNESLRGSVTAEQLATFEPYFTEFGRQGCEAASNGAFAELDKLEYMHHAGSSPGIVDGASLVVVGSKKERLSRASEQSRGWLCPRMGRPLARQTALRCLCSLSKETSDGTSDCSHSLQTTSLSNGASQGMWRRISGDLPSGINHRSAHS